MRFISKRTRLLRLENAGRLYFQARVLGCKTVEKEWKNKVGRYDPLPNRKQPFVSANDRAFWGGFHTEAFLRNGDSQHQLIAAALKGE